MSHDCKTTIAKNLNLWATILGRQCIPNIEYIHHAYTFICRKETNIYIQPFKQKYILPFLNKSKVYFHANKTYFNYQKNQSFSYAWLQIVDRY